AAPGAPGMRVTMAAGACRSGPLEAGLTWGWPAVPCYMPVGSSPALQRLLRWHRHWVRFVGREVQATVAGLGRVRARIVDVPDEATVVLQREGAAAQAIPLARIRAARLAGDWGRGTHADEYQRRSLREPRAQTRPRARAG